MKEHRNAFSKSHPQIVFRALDLDKGLKPRKVRARQHTRFNAMLHECYGGWKAIRTYLRTGKLRNIRVPPLERPDSYHLERRPMPEPEPDKHVARRKAKYYDALLVDLQVYREERPPERTTKLWFPFWEGAVACEPVQHHHYSRAASGINAALARQHAQEHGVSARSRSQTGERGWWSSTGAQGSGERGWWSSTDSRRGWRSGGGERSSSSWHRR